MSSITSGKTFSSGESCTAAKLNEMFTGASLTLTSHAGSITPDSDNARDLGSGALAWRDLHVARNVDFDGGTFTFNEAGADVNARFEGDTEANLLFLDAGLDAVGFRTSTPAGVVEVTGSTTLHTCKLTSDEVLAADKNGLFIYSNAAQTNSGANLLFVQSDNASSTADMVRFANDGTGHSLYIEEGTARASSKYGIYLHTNVAQTNGSELYVHSDHASSTADLCTFTQDGTGEVLTLSRTTAGAGDKAVISITDSAATTNSGSNLLYGNVSNASHTAGMVRLAHGGTGHGIYLEQSGVNAASRYGLYIHSNVAQVNSALCYLYSQHASSTAPTLYVNYAGSNEGLRVDGMTVANAANTVTISNVMPAGYSATIGFWWKVNFAGTTAIIPCFPAS